MNRKEPKPEIRADISPEGIEYRSDPTVFAQRFWYYVTDVGTATCPKGFAHQHQDEPLFLFHYLRQGQMWHSIANRVHHVKAGEVCLMYLQQPVRYGNDQERPAETWWVLFGGRDLSDLFLLLEADRNPVFGLRDVPRFEKLFQELLALVRDRPPGYQIQSFGVLTLLLAQLLVSRGKGDVPQIDLLNPTADGTRLSAPTLNAIRRISRHFSEPLTLHYIRDVTNLSVNHFIREFRRETGMAPMRYLTHYRIEKAKELLQSTTHPVGEVARMVGIPDCYTFAKTFRRIAGQTPTQYRETSIAENARQKNSSPNARGFMV